METEVLRCPACGGVLDIKPEDEIVKCPACGNSIRIKREKNNKTTFVDKLTGMKLGSVLLPEEFQYIGMIIPNLSTSTYPLAISCSAYDKKANVFTYFTGEGFSDVSKCPFFTGPYATEVNKINKVVYKNFMNADEYCDYYVNSFAKNGKATSIKFIQDLAFPINNFNVETQRDLLIRKVELSKQMQGHPEIKTLDYYVKPVCKQYEMVMNNMTYTMICATILEASKTDYSFPVIGLGLGNLFGGFNKKARVSSDFSHMNTNEAIDWASNGVYLLQCIKGNETDAYKNFVKFCSTFKVDDGIFQKQYEMQMDIINRINNYTQNNLAMQRQNFAMWQEINASRQAAFDAYNKSWWDNSNAHHASILNSGGSSSYSSADKFAEAMRGVNTYVRDDGSEVEVSVAYDHAYTNNLNDTLATNSSFEPGGNWSEMHRK